MSMFSCLPSDADQTSVASHHRRCWASADSISRLVTGYMCEVHAIRHLPSTLRNRWMALTARVKWVGVKQTDWRHAWLVMAGCWRCRYSDILVAQTCRDCSLNYRPRGHPRCDGRRRFVIEAGAGCRCTTHETTHRHSGTSPVTAASPRPSSRRRGRRGGRSQPAASFQLLPPTMRAGAGQPGDRVTV